MMAKTKDSRVDMKKMGQFVPFYYLLNRSKMRYKNWTYSSK